MMSIAEFYGWVNTESSSDTTSECVACGAVMNEQRGSVMYECERCMNSHEE